MQIIFLHGPAAAGKLTVGRKLSALTGIPLFHNHLVVDAVGSVFPFGSSEFIRLRHEWWLQMFSAAYSEERSIIFTFTPEPTVPMTFLDDVSQAVGGRENIQFVELTCSPDEQERRIEGISRKEFQKLQSVDLLDSIRLSEEGSIRLIPPTDCRIDTEVLSPDEAAIQLKEFLRL